MDNFTFKTTSDVNSVQKRFSVMSQLQHLTLLQRVKKKRLMPAERTKKSTQHVVQQVQRRSPESLQCHDFITGDPMAVLGWHFSVCWTVTSWINIFFTKNIFCEKLKVQCYTRWQNQNYSIWMCYILVQRAFHWLVSKITKVIISSRGAILKRHFLVDSCAPAP
jgi:hypothetical protein